MARAAGAVLLAGAVVALALASVSAYHPRFGSPALREKLEGLSKAELLDMLDTLAPAPERVASNDGQRIASVGPDGNEVYWWVFHSQDCGYDDVPGSCKGQTVAECEAMCLKTEGCGGFNTNGILKKTDCLSHRTSAPCDLYVLESKPQPPAPANFPPVWPLPATFTNGTTSVTLDSTEFKFTGTAAADLTAAYPRYLKNSFPNPTKTTGTITSADVKVQNTEVPLQLGVDESYSLDITTLAINIQANTVYGAYHALETLSQLIRFDFDSKSYVIDNVPWSIQDAPRFAHREVLVDTARHFEPVATLKALIASLPYAKINTVHWHLVDSQSFPFDSPSLPKLSQAGAYSSYERYTTEDVADVVEFARQHGVRMMVEIDTPGHAGSWCKGHPEVCPSPTCTQPLNPATNATFELIDKLFQDLTSGTRGAGLFFDNLMHLGGDEVNTACWSKSPTISAWLTKQGLTPDGGYAYFVKRVQEIAKSKGRDIVGWEEIWDHFGTKLDPSTIIHQWLPGSKIAANATSHGYRVLWSTDGVWYLDGLKTTWQTMYQQEPCTGIADDVCKKLVLGGGGEMWGETVDTSDIQQTIWPRLGAIAERLWSPQAQTQDVDAAAPRFVAFRCLLNRRAVAAAPANNAEARTSPPGPGSCYAQ